MHLLDVKSMCERRWVGVFYIEKLGIESLRDSGSLVPTSFLNDSNKIFSRSTFIHRVRLTSLTWKFLVVLIVVDHILVRFFDPYNLCVRSMYDECSC